MHNSSLNTPTQVNTWPTTDFELKQKLTQIMITGRLTPAEYNWLLAIKLQRHRLKQEASLIVDHIFDDIRNGLIDVAIKPDITVQDIAS